MIFVFSSKYKNYLRKYYYVGGMPKVVLSYVQKDDMNQVRDIQKELFQYYENDFYKHAPLLTVPRIQMVWNFPFLLNLQKKIGNLSMA